MKLGVFGGTFDPPHIGHLILAEEALAQLGLDRILWVLTPFPPHKQTQVITPLQDRMEMVLLAISGNSKFNFSRVDIDRSPPHFAADTMAVLRDKYPKDEFSYLLGADSINDLQAWHDPDRFLSLCNAVVVMQRPGEEIDASRIEQQFPSINKKLYYLNVPLIDISGTAIRSRVQHSQPIRYFVPEKVYHYILNHKLYQS